MINNFEIDQTKILTCMDTTGVPISFQLTDNEHDWIQITMKIGEHAIVWDWLQKQVLRRKIMMTEEPLGGGLYVAPGSQSIQDVILVFTREHKIYLDREARRKLVDYIRRFDNDQLD